jgi:hypothetical protein
MAFRPDPLVTVPLGPRACRGWQQPRSISGGCHSLDIPYLQRYTCCSEGMTYRTEAVSGGSCGKPWSVLESESSYRRRRVKKGQRTRSPHRALDRLSPGKLRSLCLHLRRIVAVQQGWSCFGVAKVSECLRTGGKLVAKVEHGAKPNRESQALPIESKTPSPSTSSSPA